jgi:hypothetical protein
MVNRDFRSEQPEIRPKSNIINIGRAIFGGLAALGAGLAAVFGIISGPKNLVDFHELMCGTNGQTLVDWWRDCPKPVERPVVQQPPVPPGIPPLPANLQPPPAIPDFDIENKFIVTPIYFGLNLSLSIQKLTTDTGGYVTAWICNRQGGGAQQAIVDGRAYSAAPETFQLNGETQYTSVVLLLHLERKGRDPISVLAPWDLNSHKRLAPPVKKNGLLNCKDVRGQL